MAGVWAWIPHQHHGKYSVGSECGYLTNTSVWVLMAGVWVLVVGVGVRGGCVGGGSGF